MPIESQYQKGKSALQQAQSVSRSNPASAVSQNQSVTQTQHTATGKSQEGITKSGEHLKDEASINQLIRETPALQIVKALEKLGQMGLGLQEVFGHS